ncbi:MAG: hypothetical protein HYR91_13840 [Flavobacteriia bacterium]|nr:hypothetical protein [Flavobacteriia bacterium]
MYSSILIQLHKKCILYILISILSPFHFIFSQAVNQCDFQPGNPTSNDVEVCFYDNQGHSMGPCLHCQVTGQQIKCGNGATDPYAGYYKVTFGGLICYSPATVLSVELIGFNAEIIDNQIVIFWSTFTETNNDFFSIEKSTDGINFTEIERVIGSGSSLEIKQYQFTDPNPNVGINYYRLKQTDFNGDSKLYFPISINYLPQNKVSIFPNPSNTGYFNLITDETINYYQILTPEGTLLLNDSTHLSQIDLSQYEAGYYTLIIHFKSDEIDIEKLLIQH